MNEPSGSKKFLPFSIRRTMAIKRMRLAIRLEKTHRRRLLIRLLIRHFFILRNEPRITQELYLQIIARSEKIWRQFLTDQHQENLFGKALAKHNNEVKSDFYPPALIGITGIHITEPRNGKPRNLKK